MIRPQAGVRGACAAARRQCRARGAAPKRGRRRRRPRLEGGRARVGRGRGARARLRSSREGATAKGGSRGSAGADGEGHDARDGLRHHRVVGDHGRARADHLAGRHARAPGRHGGRQQPRRRASPPARPSAQAHDRSIAGQAISCGSARAGMRTPFARTRARSAAARGVRVQMGRRLAGFTRVPARATWRRAAPRAQLRARRSARASAGRAG